MVPHEFDHFNDMTGHISAHVSGSRLTLCIVLTTVLSLSVHVLMLDVLGIPHPSTGGVPQPIVLINQALSIIATIIFYGRATPTLERFPILGRCLLLTAIYAMLNEALLRSFIMDVVVSHDWIYCFAENLAAPLKYFAVCSLIVGFAPRLKGGWAITGGGILIAALSMFAINPPIDRGFRVLIDSLEYLDTGNIYNLPYGWQVNVPSYLTFLEPVIAGYLIAALVLKRLAPTSHRQIWLFVLLILAMKRSIVPTLLYSFYQPRPFSAAILSESQFALEVLVLALLTSVGWRFSLRSQRERSQQGRPDRELQAATFYFGFLNL
jgi:hypothetical protein